MCLTVISIVVIYFFYPETKRKSLEELAAHFGETVISDPHAALEKDENHKDTAWDEKNDNDATRVEQMT